MDRSTAVLLENTLTREQARVWISKRPGEDVWRVVRSLSPGRSVGTDVLYQGTEEGAHAAFPGAVERTRQLIAAFDAEVVEKPWN